MAFFTKLRYQFEHMWRQVVAAHAQWPNLKNSSDGMYCDVPVPPTFNGVCVDALIGAAGPGPSPLIHLGMVSGRRGLHRLAHRSKPIYSGQTISGIHSGATQA
eukprot:scaffold225500_cov22-Prasinocladus_malaysianus.AAC.1